LSHTPVSETFELGLIAEARGSRGYLGYLKRHLRTSHGLLKSPLRSLSVAIVGDKHMVELHQQFMNIPSPTDVLTFELEHDSKGNTIEGEVVICLPEARRRAGNAQAALRRELLLYGLHGMLHLSGYDDKTAKGFARMHRKEDQILTQLGVGAVFSPGAVSNPGAGRNRRRPHGAASAAHFDGAHR
jgi:probable rRNA maturation factor